MTFGADDIDFASASGGDFILTSDGVIKNPDAVWKRCSLDGPKDSPLCALEVAWGNESLELLMHEVGLWATSGTNAIGVKVTCKSQSGDTAAQQAYNSSDDHSVVSVCMLIQQAGSAEIVRYRRNHVERLQRMDQSSNRSPVL